MQNSSVNNSLYNNHLMVGFSNTFIQKVMLVQILVGIFLYINCLMIFTFLKKESFREDTRYILFAQTLFVDSSLMVLSDILLIGHFFQYAIHMIPCIIMCVVSNILTTCTPLTLVAMCLERYVAICIPLRHADISTNKTRWIGLGVIWALSSVVGMFILIGYLAVAPPQALFSYAICTLEVMNLEEWQTQTRAIIMQLLFLLMIIFVAFTYVKIMAAAKAASSDTKTSTNKSLRTVALHAFQLFLCIMQFLNPYIEMIFWKIDFMVFINVRYSNFIVFIIAPRCLSPLIYGLRDERFYLVLRHYAMCGFSCVSLYIFSQWKIRPG